MHSPTARILWLIALFANASAPAGAERPVAFSSSVTIPVEEFLQLRQRSDLPKVTSIEEVVLSGQFGKSLSLTFSGRCAGGFEPRPALKIAEGFSLSGCKGDALFSASDDTLSLVPLASRFRLSCEVRPKNWNEIEIHVLNALSFSGKVSGAEVIAEHTDATERKIGITPAAGKVAARGGGEISGIAKYRVTVQPEESTFHYVFRLRNPGRVKRRYEIRWFNGEVVQKVRGLANYDESETGAELQLNPGDNEISVTGRFQGTAFKPLMASEQQYLLVESHPTLQLTIEGNGRRIAPKDPELHPRFTNGRLYVFGSQGDLSWKTRRLEVLEAMGYSITSADYRYYVPEFGNPVVEARYQLNNQGTPEIAIDVPGIATYLEVDGQPQVLYKSTDGKLLAQVPSGTSMVFVQYRGTQGAGRMLSGQRAELVKPNAVLSNVSVNLLTPAKWKVLFGSSLVGVGSDFGTSSIIAGLLLGLALWGFASWWGFSPRGALGVGITGFGLGFLAFSSLALFGALAVLLMIRYRATLLEFLQDHPWRAFLFAGVAGVPLIIVAFWGLVSFIGGQQAFVGKGISQYNSNSVRPQGKRSRGAVSEESGGGGEDEQAVDVALGSAPSPAPEPDAQSYQGLPAKIDIPYNLHETSFHQSMVDGRGRIVLRAVLMSATVLTALYTAVLALLSMALYRRRTGIRSWLRLAA